MVFEIAGGEPGSTNASSLDGKDATTSGSEESLQRAVPLSAAEAAQQKVKPTGPHAAAPGNGPHNGTPGDQQSTPTLGKVVALRIPRGQLGLLAALQAGEQVGQNANQTAAANAVFDQIGDENAAAIDSNTNGKSWLQSAGAVPLLMALAVERIAAINSRRGRKESPKPATQRPLRPTVRRLETK
jgi:hypothetical protein